MNCKISRHIIVAGALLAAQPCVEAGSLRKVWELRLDPVIKEPAGLGSSILHTVNAIRFSPNDQQLAVVVDMHSTEDAFASHLLIFETKSPGMTSQQLELDRGVFPGDEYPSLPPLFWSPDGDSVAVFGLIISLREGKMCSSDSFGVSVGGYLNNQTVVGRGGPPGRLDLEHPRSRFVLFSPRCRLQDTWNVDDAWLTGDVSPDRGLALVQQLDFHPSERVRATLLVDFRGKQILRRWLVDEILPKQVRFAEGGRTFCAAAGTQNHTFVPVRCLDVDTGRVIAEAASVKRAWSIVAASESSRVVISQYRPEPENIPTTSVVDRRVVWDFRNGQQVAVWRPEFQKWRFPMGKIRQWRSNPFVFAISPTGKYIAEGGNGVLRLFEIEP